MALITVRYNLTMDEYANNKAWKNHITNFYDWYNENFTDYCYFGLAGLSIHCEFKIIEEAMAFKLRWL